MVPTALIACVGAVFPLVLIVAYGLGRRLSPGPFIEDWRFFTVGYVVLMLASSAIGIGAGVLRVNWTILQMVGGFGFLLYLYSLFVAFAMIIDAIGRRRIQLQGGLICRACSYTLFGNCSGVCPECGTPFMRALDESR